MRINVSGHNARAVSTAWLTALGLIHAGCLMPGNPGDPQVASCLVGVKFGEPADSPYVLPYPVGESYEVFQTYCGPVSHGRDGQMAIDFLMPVGSAIVASRDGIVRAADDQYPDGGRRFNSIYIEHSDGSSAFYGHLKQGSVAVQVGDAVRSGQFIARSGSSGTSLPHLHFGVARSWPVKHPDDLPVNFNNADGPLDERGGLVRAASYLARPAKRPPGSVE
jgi:murein DD-endopeptidase MepM/ murein hydrolase activator NlpD